VVPGQTDLTFELPYDEQASYTWTVPEGTTISGKSDSSAITVDWGCTEGAVVCHLATICSGYERNIQVKIRENKIEGDIFFTDNQSGMEYSVMETANATYSWSVPEGAAITFGQGTNSITLDMGTKEGLVTVEIENACGKNTLVKYVLYPGQYPYPDPMQPHILPGTIEPVLFDYGGEGVAYHDGSTSNQGNGSRQDEFVDTELNDGGETIGYILAGEWIEYTIRVDTPGIYYTEMRIASELTTAIPLKILVNNQDRLGQITLPNTGGSQFVSVYPGQMELFVTDTILRYEMSGGGFKIGRFIVTSYNPVSILETTGYYTRIYPNPVDNYLMVTGIDRINNIEIMDLSGKIIKSVSVLDCESGVEVKGLSPGIYGLRITYSDGSRFITKFVKL
ncbi:MAG: T9SS type A sorting domain-containing protein, partial [Bacteroidales bacterium]